MVILVGLGRLVVWDSNRRGTLPRITIPFIFGDSKGIRTNRDKNKNNEPLADLGGSFKHFLFSSLFGEDSHLDDHIFQKGLVQPPTRLADVRMGNKGDLAIMAPRGFGEILRATTGGIGSVTGRCHHVMVG